GLGEDELGLDFALQEGDIGEADGEYTQEGLEGSLQAVEDEIKDLFSDGKITEDLRDELLGRHGRIEGELDLKTANLDMVGEMIEGLRENLASIRSEFVDSGEPIDAIDGEEDLSKYPETVNRMAAWLKANGSPDIKAKDLMEKAEELGLSEDDLKYPSLPPSENFMTFLTEVDPGLKHLMDEYRAQLGSQAATQAAEEEPEMPPVYPGLGLSDPTGPMGLMGPGAEWAERLEEQERQAAADSELAPARSAVRDRLYGLLKAIFPDAGLANAVISDTQSPAFNKSDDLVINNINYDIFENATGKLRFAEWAQADA
ncbi:MAG TPA: hypothetical protein VJR29_13705, partial [bacterium]|nr:hypothetical protein [bacterium]